MNTNIQGGFQICIRVALKEREERLMRKKKKIIFIIFKEYSVAKNCLSPESALLDNYKSYYA